MILRRFVAAFSILTVAAAIALAASGKEFRSIKGTWMCPTCAGLKQSDTPEQCEAKGHRHALKLDDGKLITFLESPRAAALVHGGGREQAKIEVCGLFDEATQSLDVEAYRIDDVWSTWCGTHNLMDFCRSTGGHGSDQGAGSKK